MAATPDTLADEDELLAIARGTPTMVELLAMLEAADIEFEPPKVRFDPPPVDLSDREQAEFFARGERAWHEYQRTGQSTPAVEVFDRIQERIDARRQLSENKDARDK